MTLAMIKRNPHLSIMFQSVISLRFGVSDQTFDLMTTRLIGCFFEDLTPSDRSYFANLPPPQKKKGRKRTTIWKLVVEEFRARTLE